MTRSRGGAPERSAARVAEGRDLELIARLLDDTFRVPGSRRRIGLEAVIGLIPVVGDVVLGAIGGYLVLRALRYRLPGVVVARMAFNTVVDIAVGAIPILGDAFDFVWKSNRRNIALFERHAEDARGTAREEWRFFAGLALVVLGTLVLLGMALRWIAGEVARLLG